MKTTPAFAHVEKSENEGGSTGGVSMAEGEASILIVEDEKSVCAILTYLLSPRFQCVTATSANEAMRLIDSKFFNVVLADIGLPGMSGLELCRYVVEKSPRTAVIIVSGQTEAEMAIQAVQAGAFGYITKPFELSQVKAIVERALNSQLSGESS